MKQRPETLESKTTRILTGYGNLYVTITEMDGKPFEVFCTLGKSGSSIMAKAEVTGRMTSLALRNGIAVEEVIDQLIDIDGGKPEMWHGELVKSIPDAVAKVLKMVYGEKDEG